MVKFSKQIVLALLRVGEHEVKVVGYAAGILLEGSDVTPIVRLHPREQTAHLRRTGNDSYPGGANSDFSEAGIIALARLGRLPADRTYHA
jgi:hypothetical protein